MTKSYSQFLGPQIAGKLLAHLRWKPVTAVCLTLASFVAFESRVALGADATASAATQENSLLVATREAPAADSSASSSASTSADGDALEPVPQSSDRTPELATADDARAPLEFGAASTKGWRKSRDSAPGDTVREPVATPPKKLRRTPSVPPTSTLHEPVKFRRILVGQSTKQELFEAWGEPAESVATPEGAVLAYDIDPFQVVEVLVGSGNVVSAIKIALATPLEPKSLAEQLSLHELRPVTVKDEQDQPLGQTFPERGVLFMFNASEADALAGDGNAALSVSHVVLQRLDPLAFAMRAENCLHGPYAQNIADLKSAIEIDPACAHAHWLLAKIYLATGQADLADAAAREACEIDPKNASYQLCRGQTQALLGEYDNSVLTVRAVLDREDIAPIDRAQALHQMAGLASLGDVEIASKAISFDTRAIEIADRLATSMNAKERRAAKQLLIDAHMAVAEEIARQSFNQKTQNLSLWIGRASGLAEEYIANDGGSVELRLLIAQRALAALASFRPTLDPAPWVAEAEEAAQVLFAQSDDDLWQAHIKWELGIAHFNALRVQHVRRETQTALQYGQKAVDDLAEGAASRQAVHSSEQLVGQLYFQMGAVYAVHQLDHVKAAQWYDRAEPLLTGPRPVSELYAPRREGEMLVSIGVTFWQLGEQARALELTQSGVHLVEMAVDDGILAKSTLAVPYGNLSTMYQKMGENTNAAKYAALAKTVAGSATTIEPPQVGRAPAGGPDSNAVQTSAQRPRATARR